MIQPVRLRRRRNCGVTYSYRRIEPGRRLGAADKSVSEAGAGGADHPFLVVGWRVCRLGVGVAGEAGESGRGLLRERGGVPVLVDAQHRAQAGLGPLRCPREPVHFGRASRISACNATQQVCESRPAASSSSIRAAGNWSARASSLTRAARHRASASMSASRQRTVGGPACMCATPRRVTWCAPYLARGWHCSPVARYGIN
jgi:hypothetical protein